MRLRERREAALVFIYFFSASHFLVSMVLREREDAAVGWRIVSTLADRSGRSQP
jgi:hypothetical protein